MAVETVDLRGCLLGTWRPSVLGGECRDGAEAGDSGEFWGALSKFQAWLNTLDLSCVRVDALLDRLVPMRCGRLRVGSSMGMLLK
jgi:hypothetical protein